MTDPPIVSTSAHPYTSIWHWASVATCRVMHSLHVWVVIRPSVTHLALWSTKLALVDKWTVVVCDMWHTYISTYSYDNVVAYMYNIGDEVEGKFVMSEHKELIYYSWKTKERYAFRMFCILFFFFCFSIKQKDFVYH